MLSSGNEARAPLLVLFTTLACSFWATVSATSPQADLSNAGPRVRQLLEGPVQPKINCQTHIRNGNTLFECEADSWGKWQLTWRNPDTAEITIVQWDAHNRAIGRKLTTNPGQLIVTFWGERAEPVTKVIEVVTPLQLCTRRNHCFRV